MGVTAGRSVDGRHALAVGSFAEPEMGERPLKCIWGTETSLLLHDCGLLRLYYAEQWAAVGTLASGRHHRHA